MHPALAFLFLLVGTVAFADESGLDGTYSTEPPPVQQLPADPAPTDLPPAADEEEAPPPAVIAPVVVTSPRFTAEEDGRLRRWLVKLCRENAVPGRESERVKFSREATRTELKALNKTGSLLLLLENYGELATFRDHCEEERKANPQACVEKGRLPKPWEVKDTQKYPWITFGSSKFWSEVNQNRAPAGIERKTDLLRESAAQVNAIKDVLKKEFFDFRDVADLGGKKGSGAAARKLADTVRGESTCATRAVAEFTQK